MKYCLVIVCAALLEIGCGESPQGGAAVERAFRHAVSRDAQTLVSFRFDRLKGSEFYRRHAQQLAAPLDELSGRAGLDPRKDLSNLLLVWDGKNAMLLAAGEFSAAAVEAKLAANGARQEPYKKFTLYARGGDAVAFPQPGVAIASTTAGVEEELDLFSSEAGGVPAGLKERMAEIPGDAQIWEASRGGLPASNFPIRADLGSALSNIAASVAGTSFGLRFDEGSHLRARVVCNSAEGAQRVNDALRGLIGLARLNTNSNEIDLLRIWDAVSITRDGPAIRIEADLAADLTDKLLAQIAALRGAARAR